MRIIHDIINDNKLTIERLQKECTNKTDTIIKLIEQIKELEDKNIQLKNQIAIDYDYNSYEQNILRDKAENKIKSLELILKEKEKRINNLRYAIIWSIDALGASSLNRGEIREKLQQSIKEN